MSEKKKAFVDPSCDVSVFNAANVLATSGWNTSILEILDLNAYAEEDDT